MIDIPEASALQWGAGALVALMVMEKVFTFVKSIQNGNRVDSNYMIKQLLESAHRQEQSLTEIATILKERR